MSIGKSLAEKYVKKDFSKSEILLKKIQDLGLESVLGNFKNNLNKISKNNDFYNVCKIYSSKDLNEEQILEIKSRYGVPANADTDIKIDENILGGVVVYYQGKKWNESVRGAFDRFNEL
jgi:F0F1-type ATP synthase delta subunit